MTNDDERPGFIALDNERRGYYARPGGAGPFPAVLVLQEAFGVNDYVASEVRRLAGAGYAALAPDLFRGETLSYTDWEPVKAKLQTLDDAALLADVRAALAFLDARDEVARGARGAVGFCMGGRLAFLSAAEFGERFVGAVSFYGGSVGPERPGLFPSVLARGVDIRAPLMFHYGADDESIAPDEHARVARALSEWKKAYSLNVYPGAGHGFASIDRPSYRRDVAEAAWAATLEFFKEHLAA